MKKFVICLIGAIILSNCNISCSTSSANPEKYYDYYSWEDKVINGMTYRIFYSNRNISYSSAALFVVNLTKDALEVELLKKQLNSK